MSCGLLFLWLGGAHVASLAHQTLGLPGVLTLRHSSAVTLLSPSASFPSKMEICHNLQAAFQKVHNDTEDGSGYVLMINETKVEERLRWDPSLNKILGLC